MTEPLSARAVLGYSNLRLAGQDWPVFSAATPLRVVQAAQPLAVLASGRSGNAASSQREGTLERRLVDC